MELWQQLILSAVGIGSLIIFGTGLYKSWRKSCAFEQMSYLGFMGIFVWGDAVALGPFWAFVSGLCLFFKDFTLFLLIVSLFWSVRSIGEMIYWFNQQFSQLNRNPPERLKGYRFFKNDAVWIMYQVGWQCAAVLSIVCSLYFGSVWLKSLS